MSNLSAQDFLPNLMINKTLKSPIQTIIYGGIWIFEGVYLNEFSMQKFLASYNAEYLHFYLTFQNGRNWALVNHRK